MPDPIKEILANPLQVQRLWGKAPGDNCDVLPLSPRVAQMRARYAGLDDDDVSRAIAEHPRCNDALDALLADMNATMNAEDGEDEEMRDRLIVLPSRGEEAEDPERWDGMS